MQNTKLNANQKRLRKRIIDISFANKLSHIGSCLNSVDLIDAVYEYKKSNESFVLSSGHAAVALYTVIEKHDPSLRYDKINCLHPDRLSDKNIQVSTGSLGQGLPISIGLALANRDAKVYCLLSDGECSEGSVWESLRIISDISLTNLVILISVNGYGAYDAISSTNLKKRLSGFGLNLVSINGHDPKAIKSALTAKVTDRPSLVFANTSSEQLSFLSGLGAHYYVMGQDYQEASNQFS